MSSVIRADTDQLRNVARQMRSAADQILTRHQAMGNTMDVFAETWSGSARERGMARWAEIFPQYPPAIERLAHFASELDGLATRLDEAARVFGDGIDLTKLSSDLFHKILDKISIFSPQTPPQPPGTMQRMFEITQEGDEIKVFQTGENEYVVTLKGSEMFDLFGMNSLFPNAMLGGVGLGTLYTKRLKEALAYLPSGANVHLFGYSQGGIVAQNLAIYDQHFLSDHNLHVKSINTYGTPNPLIKVPGVDYSIDIDAPGDLVSNLCLPMTLDPGNNSITFNDESVMAISGFNAIPGISTHLNGYDEGSNAVQMEMESKVPFEGQQWKLIYSSNDSETKPWDSGAALFTENVPRLVNTAVDTYNTLVDVGDQVWDAGKEFVGDGLDAIKGAGTDLLKRLF